MEGFDGGRATAHPRQGVELYAVYKLAPWGQSEFAPGPFCAIARCRGVIVN